MHAVIDPKISKYSDNLLRFAWWSPFSPHFVFSNPKSQNIAIICLGMPDDPYFRPISNSKSQNVAIISLSQATFLKNNSNVIFCWCKHSLHFFVNLQNSRIFVGFRWFNLKIWKYGVNLLCQPCWCRYQPDFKADFCCIQTLNLEIL